MLCGYIPADQLIVAGIRKEEWYLLAVNSCRAKVIMGKVLQVRIQREILQRLNPGGTEWRCAEMKAGGTGPLENCGDKSGRLRRTVGGQELSSEKEKGGRQN